MITTTTPPTTTPKKQKEGPDDRHVARLVSVYTIIVFVVILYFLVNIWPATPQELASNATRPVTLYGTGVHFLLGPETLIIFIIMFFWNNRCLRLLVFRDFKTCRRRFQ